MLERFRSSRLWIQAQSAQTSVDFIKSVGLSIGSILDCKDLLNPIILFYPGMDRSFSRFQAG